MTEQTLTASPVDVDDCLVTAAEVEPAELPLADVISANVRILRRRRRWTQSEAGQHWGEITGRPLNSATWSIAERSGGRAWTAADIATAAELFDVMPAELLVPLGVCTHCGDQPPAGYICATCGISGTTSNSTSTGRE